MVRCASCSVFTRMDGCPDAAGGNFATRAFGCRRRQPLCTQSKVCPWPMALAQVWACARVCCLQRRGGDGIDGAFRHVCTLLSISLWRQGLWRLCVVWMLKRICPTRCVSCMCPQYARVRSAGHGLCATTSRSVGVRAGLVVVGRSHPSRQVLSCFAITLGVLLVVVLSSSLITLVGAFCMCLCVPLVDMLSGSGAALRQVCVALPAPRL